MKQDGLECRVRNKRFWITFLSQSNFDEIDCVFSFDGPIFVFDSDYHFWSAARFFIYISFWYNCSFQIQTLDKSNCVNIIYQFLHNLFCFLKVWVFFFLIFFLNCVKHLRILFQVFNNGIQFHHIFLIWKIHIDWFSNLS